MGKKISIDSATLMNKGLELIEARWLFDCNLEKLRVVIHPQSIVHSFVHFFDGSVMAQLGQPDMRIPIAFCLGWPQRIASGSEGLDISQIRKLEFLEPDRQKFRSLDLAESCLEIGMNSAIYLNSANEVAVDAFLKRKIKFTTITHIVSEILEKANFHEPESIADVKDAGVEARAMAYQSLKKWNSR